MPFNIKTLQSITELTGLNEGSFAIFSPNSSRALLRRQDFVNCKIKYAIKECLFLSKTKFNQAIHFNSFHNQLLTKGISPWWEPWHGLVFEPKKQNCQTPKIDPSVSTDILPTSLNSILRRTWGFLNKLKERINDILEMGIGKAG